jgi:glycosyltransferase involved in cell wall biosynthesis
MFRRRQQKPVPLDDRGPLRVMFMVTSMPVGGAETLLVNLVRRMERERFAPEVCCLKERGPLGEELALTVPVHSRLLAGKYDLRVLPRLVRLFRRRRVDAVVTVGAGDKMFWGRLAAWQAGVPVVASALHSTGWPDGVGRLNRRLTPLTDVFIAVAEPHGRHLIEVENFPAEKVRVISNGVDTERFCEKSPCPDLRRELEIEEHAPVAVIVAALRPEKNHELLLAAFKQVSLEAPEARLLIVGDGPRRDVLEQTAKALGIDSMVRFLGTRGDIPEILALANVFVLSSHNEANPVSILEAMACGKPVVATDVGSVGEAVIDTQTGFLVEPGDAQRMARHLIHLFRKPALARRMGRLGRQHVIDRWSLTQMVRGYEALIGEIYTAKCGAGPGAGTNHPLPDLSPDRKIANC